MVTPQTYACWKRSIISLVEEDRVGNVLKSRGVDWGPVHPIPAVGCPLAVVAAPPNDVAYTDGTHWVCALWEHSRRHFMGHGTPPGEGAARPNRAAPPITPLTRLSRPTVGPGCHTLVCVLRFLVGLPSTGVSLVPSVTTTIAAIECGLWLA
jgi:hypothetical protein